MLSALKITKAGVFLVTTILAETALGQVIYDPTIVYDKPGQLYHHNQIHTLELEFYNANYHATLTYWKQNNIDNALPAKFDYAGIHFDSVAVKYKGNSTFVTPNTFNNPKVPYNIDLNDLVPGQQVFRYRKLKLGNAYFDPSFCKEVLASYIYKQYLPCYEANLIKLYVNGDYLGVYVNEEDVGFQFLKKHFGENNGPFFKCEPMTESEAGHPVDLPDLVWRGNDTLNYYESYQRKSSGGWSEFLNFIDVLNNNPANIEQVLNVDRVLWNFAVTQVLSNEDTYNTTIIHNYYMYQTPDGKFQMLPWDLTESFCGVLFTQGTAQSHYELDPLYGLNPYFVDRPLVYQLLSDSYYRKRYFAHIRTVMEEYYDYSWIQTWTLNLQALAELPVQQDPNKPHNMTKFHDNLYDPVNWLLIYKIAAILDVVEHRRPYLENYPDINQNPPQISDVTQSIQNPVNTDTVYVGAYISNATSVKLKVTNNNAPYASDFIAVSMYDNGINGDQFAGDGIFTAAIPFHGSNEHIKYYIEAENSQALALMPERAEYFYYHYYIDQVLAATSNEKPICLVYPNPASELIYIEPALQDKPFGVKMFNLNGQLCLEEYNLQGKQEIRIDHLNPGSYLLQITQNGKIWSEKITIC